MKWEGYHPQESTWEPASHISDELLDSYMCPSVCKTRLGSAALTFENTIQQCLSSKASSVSTGFPLDIYRYVFGTDHSMVIKAASEIKKTATLEKLDLQNKSNRAWCQSIVPYQTDTTLLHEARLRDE